MARHGEGHEPVEAEEDDTALVSPVAIEVALDARRRRRHGEGPDESDAFLRKQTEMLQLQMEHLHEQRELNLDHLRWRRFGDRWKAGLQVLSGMAGVAILTGVALMAWDAHRDHSLVIDGFSVPPALAQRGLTGQVLAAHMMDRLADIQSQTDSARAPDTFRGHGEDEVRLEIPETGVTVGELRNALIQWLGHREHITGELYQTRDGLSLAARVAEQPGWTFTGPADEEEALVARAAEAIYRETQPYRYGVYLWQKGRTPEALEVFRDLALNGPEGERPWAYFGWGGVLGAAGDLAGQVEKANAGLALNPDLAAGWQTLALAELARGRSEAATTAFNRELKALERGSRHGLVPRAAAQSQLLAAARVQEARADYLAAAQTWARSAGLSDYQSAGADARIQRAIDLAWAHDPSAQDALGAAEAGEATPLLKAQLAVALRFAANDWRGLPAQLAPLEAELSAAPHARRLLQEWSTSVAPWQAYAAQRNDAAEVAAAVLDHTPADCARCIMARGMVAAERGEAANAVGWLRRATVLAPADPMTWLQLGLGLARGGDSEGALKAWATASRLAPRWADPRVASATVLDSQGRRLEARKAWQQARALAPAWDLEPKV